MPQNKDFARRIEILDECLGNNLRKWTLDSLIEAVNTKLYERYGKRTSRRTIQNDLKSLTEDNDAPISKYREGNITYYKYSDSDFSIKNLPIRKEEVDLLNDAINILRQVSDFKIQSEVDAIVSKLRNTVQTNVEGASAIIHFERHTTALGTHLIDDIFSAIKLKIPLRIIYQSFKATSPHKFILHPFLLKEYRNRWFVIGRDSKRPRLVVLALDRIKEIKNSSEEYQRNDTFDPNTYFNNLIGVTMPANAQVEKVDIKISSEHAPYIKTKPIHHSQQIISEDEDGGLLVQIFVVINPELKSVLLSYGCNIEVLKPELLRTEVRKVFELGFNCYR